MVLIKKGAPARGLTLRLLWTLIIWFTFFTICYIFLFLEDDHIREKLTKTGVFISKDIASQAGLPLLEKNTDRLGELLKKVSNRPGVVYASIIDHKNKLIAYTDQKQFLTLDQQGWHMLDHVQYSEVTGTKDQTVINFSSEVTFSGTRIGEIFISLATHRMTSKKQLFLGAAFLSLVLILSTFVSAQKKINSPLWIRLKALFAVKTSARMPVSNLHAITCPLCGKESCISQKEFAGFDFNRFPILRPTVEEEKPVMLNDLGKMKEMTWLKRRIVLQCTKIINKLIAN